MYDKKNHEPKNNFLDFKKWEEKEEFSIYEYQVQEIKEDEEFFSVILLGDTLFLKIMPKKIQKVIMNWTYTKIKPFYYQFQKFILLSSGLFIYLYIILLFNVKIIFYS